MVLNKSENLQRLKDIKNQSKNVKWLLFIVFVDGIGFGIILPLLPVMSINYGLTTLELAVIVASFSFCQLITSPLLGAISDKIGRKKVIVFCLFAISASYFILSFATTFISIIIARIIAGSFTGNISVVLASGSDISSPHKRSLTMGYIGGAAALGYMLGPTISGILAGNDLAETNFSLVFIISGMFTCIAAVLASIFFKETIHHMPERRVDTLYNRTSLKSNILRAAYKVVFDRSTTFIMYLSIITWFSFSAIYVFLTTWSVAEYSLSPLQLGIIGTMFAFFTALVQIFSPLLIKGYKSIALGFILTSIGVILIVTNPSIVEMAFILIIIATGLGFLFPNLNATVSMHGTKRQRGVVLGLSQSAGTLGQTTGPILIGLIYMYSSYVMAWVTISLLLAMAAFLTIRKSLMQNSITSLTKK